MKTPYTLVVFLVLAACATPPDEPSTLDVRTIDAEAQRLMARESVHGMALAVIEGGQIVHVAAYGRRSVSGGL